MKIAVNTRFLIDKKMEGIGWYTFEILRHMVAAHPEVEFHFLFDRPYVPAFLFGPSVVPHVLYPPARHPWLWHIWFEWSVPHVLKRIKPDVFFSPDNFLSLSTTVPTVMTVHDLIPFTSEPDISRRALNFYRRQWPKYIKQAAHLITISEETKRNTLELFGIEPHRITLVYNGIKPGYKPNDVQLDEQLRAHSTAALASTFAAMTPQSHQGAEKPYFIVIGSIHERKNIPSAIAAFNLFKRATGLPHQLVLAGKKMYRPTATHPIEMAIAQSPYAHEILYTGYLSEEALQLLTRNAVALLFLSLAEGFGLPIVECFASGVPVVCSNVSVMPEIAQDAALLRDPLDAHAVALAMQALVEDTNLRHILIQRGFERAKAFNWAHAADEIFKILQKHARTGSANAQ